MKLLPNLSMRRPRVARGLGASDPRAQSIAVERRARENRPSRMDADRLSLVPATIAAAVTVRDDVGIEADRRRRLGRARRRHRRSSRTRSSARCTRPAAHRGASGWTPCYLTAWRGSTLAGAMPLYAKAHSYGEYVFDWAWADAYRRYGRRYYPKLVAAIPFTPAPGPAAVHDRRRRAYRVAARRAASAATAAPPRRSAVFVAARPVSHRSRGARLRGRRACSCATACNSAGRIPGYRDFADFLATFNHDKRKKVKQERRKRRRRRHRVHAQGRRRDHFRRLGVLLSLLRAHVSRAPFDALSQPGILRAHRRRAAGNLMLALGRRGRTPICAALDVFDAGTLWGRYWGTTERVSGLHFEACYYQAIDFCIERRIARFEGGAQGVHKLARGLVPVTTWSAHAIADRRVRRARSPSSARGSAWTSPTRSTSSTRRDRSAILCRTGGSGASRSRCRVQRARIFGAVPWAPRARSPSLRRVSRIPSADCR